MKRLRLLWERILNSYWFIPSLLTLAGGSLAVVTIWLDRRVTAVPDEMWLVFGVGAEGARGVLSAIAGSVITVTGVVFSITVVALQLASQQFTPRILRTFASDRAGHLVLGTLIATFTYALLVERTVRSSDGDMAGFVPSISLTVAVVLALASVGSLIFFVHHTAQSIRASTIVDRVTRDVHRIVDRLYPQQIGRASDAAVVPPEPAGSGAFEVASAGAGYIQAVDEDTLFRLAEEGKLTLRLHHQVGDFLLAGDSLATVWSPEIPGDEIAEALNRAFVLGPERTLQEDVRRGLLELVEIAVKALSPSVNDPTTAIRCIDRLAEVVARLGCRDFPSRSRAGADGAIRVYAPRQDFGALAEMAFDQIRHYGADAPAVMLHLVEALRRVGGHLPPGRRGAIRLQLERVREGAAVRIALPSDAERVRRAAVDALATLG